MPDTTTLQSLPLIQPSQAQKHVTHNEALKKLDVLVQLTVQSRTLTVAPGIPLLGETHIVGVGATGVWAGRSKQVAVFTGIGWEYYSPREGWRAFVSDEEQLAVFHANSWATPAEAPAEFSRLGIQATADDTTRLAISSDNSLFDNAGAGHQMKINKASVADTASIQFQTADETRVEMGTIGNDDFTIQVSPDGTAFVDGLKIDTTTGRVTTMAGIVLNPGSADIATPTNGSLWYNSTTGSFRARQAGATVDLLTTANPVTFGSSVTSVAMNSASLTALYAGLGGATGDATNRLAVNAPATLLNNAGAGHQLKINKALATDTASLLFQTGFSGRAEMGTTGSDDFAIKVSADGTTFNDAVSFDRNTGRTVVNKGLRLTPAAGDLAGSVDGEIWYNSTTGKLRARQAGSLFDVIGGGGGGGGVFSDAVFTVQDDADATKQVRLQLGPLTTGTTRTLTVPDSNGTLVLRELGQTFSGANTFSGPTNTFGSSVTTSTYGLGSGATTNGNTKAISIGTAGLTGSTTNVVIGSTVSGALGTTTINSPTVAFGTTVTAINLPDAATFLTDNVDPAKRLQFEVTAITSGATRTVSVPDASGTMVLAAAAQTLTNKTIDLSANTITGTMPATNVGMTGGGTAQDYAGFATRANFVTWAGTKTPALGTTIDAAGFSYRYTGTATAISDLPGWLPRGNVFPDHFGQNTNPGTTNMAAAILAALNYASTVYLAPATYAVGSTIAWDNGALMGGHQRGILASKILGLSASIPVGQAILAPGRTSTVRGVQISYDTLTGSETQDQRVGIDARGLSLALQRGSVLDEIFIDNVGTGISDFGSGEFSVTYGAIEIGDHSYRAVDIRGQNRTGSVWENLYINGGTTYTPEGGFCYSGQGAGGVVLQLNIEHAAYTGYPVRIDGAQGMVINSLHIEGVDCLTANTGYIALDSASVTIQSLNVLNTRMSADNTAVVRLGRAAYQSSAISSPLTTASTGSNLSIGKLHLKGIASPSNTIYPTYPVGRTGVRNCPGFAVFKRDTSFTDNNWLVEVQDYLWGAFAAQAADRPFLDFPENSFTGNIQIKRLAERGANVVPYENYVLNGAFDKWLATTATVTSGAQEVANKWTLRGTTGSVTLDRVQDSYGALGQWDARVTVGTAGTGQSLDQDIAFPVEWVGQPLRLTFAMRATVAGRVLEQVTATLVNSGGGVPATVVKQVLSGTDTRLDATTAFKTYVLDFTAVDAASITTLGTAAVMRLSFQFNDTVASRSPVVTFGSINLSKVNGPKFARAPYDRLALTTADVAGLGALATAGSVNLTTQATGVLQAAQAPAHTGDVTSSAGSLALTIAGGVVSNAKLATMAANTVKANATAGAAVPTDVALGASQLFGRGATGDIAPITLGTNLSMTGTTLNATGGGGGGSPGGVSGQVQFNNAGAFAGATNVDVEGGDLRLDAVASPATPAAGGVKLVGRTSAGKTRPAFVSQDGIARDLQAWLGKSNPLIVKANPGATTLSIIGLGAVTAVGTASIANTATTNRHTRQPRVDYLVTAASTTAVAGFRFQTQTVTVGGAGATEGGFEFVGIWGPATGVATATLRAAFGLFQAGAAPTDVEPSSLNNGVWMGWDAADTNVQIMSKSATGTATKIDLGASFPVPTSDRTALYQLEMSSPPGTTSSVTWTVTNLVTGATANGTITTTTDLPSNTTLLLPKGWCSVGGTSSVVGFALSSIYLDPLI